VTRRAADLVASGVLQLDKLITRKVSLKEAADMITRSQVPGEVKVLAVP
jgi:L-iditol 2-dehydrogenase